MKLLLAFGLTASLALTSLAAEPTKRNPTSAQRKIKIFEGTSTAHKFITTDNTYSISFSGASARLIWQSIKAKGEKMAGAGEDQEWYQKTSTHITCDRIYDKSDRKSEYSCSMVVSDGEFGSPGVG